MAPSTCQSHNYYKNLQNLERSIQKHLSITYLCNITIQNLQKTSFSTNSLSVVAPPSEALSAQWCPLASKPPRNLVEHYDVLRTARVSAGEFCGLTSSVARRKACAQQNDINPLPYHVEIFEISSLHYRHNCTSADPLSLSLKIPWLIFLPTNLPSTSTTGFGAPEIGLPKNG